MTDPEIHDPEQPTRLKGQLLIATPMINSGLFAQSVIYLCQHDNEGAMGIIINKPSDIPCKRMFDQLDIRHLIEKGEQPIFHGGPVSQDRGLILHPPVPQPFESTVQFNDSIALTSSKDVLTAFASGEAPAKAIIALGYAGWDAGQLEQELVENSWLTVPADPDLLFEVAPEKRFKTAIARAGFSPATLSCTVGHA